MEERIEDEDSEWNYFELKDIDDLFEELTMTDAEYVPPVIVKEVIKEVVKTVHIHHDDDESESESRRHCHSNGRTIDVASQTWREEQTPSWKENDLPNTRWNEKYQ